MGEDALKRPEPRAGVQPAVRARTSRPWRPPGGSLAAGRRREDERAPAGGDVAREGVESQGPGFRRYPARGRVPFHARPSGSRRLRPPATSRGRRPRGDDGPWPREGRRGRPGSRRSPARGRSRPRRPSLRSAPPGASGTRPRRGAAALPSPVSLRAEQAKQALGVQHQALLVDALRSARPWAGSREPPAPAARPATARTRWQPGP